MVRLFLILLLVTIHQSAFSQISELQLTQLDRCTSVTLKDTLKAIDQSYTNGTLLYKEVIYSNLSEVTRSEKLNDLFRIQVDTKKTIQNIWSRFDSVSHNYSKKYFVEAERAYKELTDTLNVYNPNFRSVSTGLVVIERLHQIILLQRLGLYKLFGCTAEHSGNLAQPSGYSADIEVNIEMIERFRAVWNQSNYPMTYDLWFYSPTERKSFSNIVSTVTSKDQQTTAKEDVAANVSNTQLAEVSKDNVEQDVPTQKPIDFPSRQNDIENRKKDYKPESNKRDSNKRNLKDNGNSNNEKESSTNSVSPKIATNKTSTFEIMNLKSREKISTMAIDYFTIQIAASKSKLNSEVLKKNYSCQNFEPKEVSEDGWYKYLIGNFATFDEANSHLKDQCIQRGLISGYNSKGRVAILSIKQPASFATSASAATSTSPSSSHSIVFRLQIAASKQLLSNDVISKIYSGDLPINASLEDDWYRYSIGDFIYLDDAKVALDSCHVKDAFIMPYQQGSRIQWPSKNALKKLSAAQKETPIYVVQVAASRKPLNYSTVQSINKGNYPITMKFEDGWYKYYISAFTNFAAAKQVVQQIEVNGAFTATYLNGKRVLNVKN